MTTRYLQLHRRTRSLGRTRNIARLVRVHGPVGGAVAVQRNELITLVGEEPCPCCKYLVCSKPVGAAVPAPVEPAATSGDVCAQCGDARWLHGPGGSLHDFEPAALSVVEQARSLGYEVTLLIARTGTQHYAWRVPGAPFGPRFATELDAARDALRFHEQQAVAAPVPVRAADALPDDWHLLRGALSTYAHASGAEVCMTVNRLLWWSFGRDGQAISTWQTMHLAMRSALGLASEADLWPSVPAIEGGGAHG